MKKVAIYTGFAAASLTEAALFLTSTTYFQLAFAILLYIPLVYVALKLFPRRTSFESTTAQTIPIDNAPDHSVSGHYDGESIQISDIDKRVFLKLIGVTGLSFFISSLFTRRFESRFLGGSAAPGSTTIKDPTGNLISPAIHQPTDNYKISEVDYGVNTFYGFIDTREGWFIMKEDLDAGTYRYIKGDTNFRDNWNNRENLKYDYFNRVFPKS